MIIPDWLNGGLLALGAEQLHGELSTGEAQVAYVYSCVSRKWILGADVLVELAPIDALAPSAGFFCYGEYFGRPHGKPLFLSQTLTVLCLSETDAEARKADAAEQTPEPTSLGSRQFRTMRVLHRLVETSAREIESMNQELAGLVGTTRETVTKILNDMKRPGLIEFDRHQITILALNRIQRMVM